MALAGGVVGARPQRAKALTPARHAGWERLALAAQHGLPSTRLHRPKIHPLVCKGSRKWADTNLRCTS